MPIFASHNTRDGGGGHAFTRGALYDLLRNRIYLGGMGHKGQIHKGEHPAIPATLDDPNETGADFLDLAYFGVTGSPAPITDARARARRP